MTAKHDASKSDTNLMLAKVLAELMQDAAEAPASIDLLRDLFDKDDGRDLARAVLLAIVPRRVDGDAWNWWIEGGPVPTPVKRIDPDRYRSPGTSGAFKGALSRRDEAARDVARKQEQLDAVRRLLAEREVELQEAEDRMRALLVFRLLHQIVREGAGAFAMGPLYTIARAISPYLQRDVEWEASLSEARTQEVEGRRKTRRAESIEILDGLDRLAGDEALELNLHRTILTAIRQRLAQVQGDVTERREKGVASTKLMKLRAVRRSLDNQKSGLHEAAPLADRSDVFDAFESLDGPSEEQS